MACGSAFLNLFFNGCRSLFGKDWTNLSVWENMSARSDSQSGVISSSYVFAANGLNDVVWWCTEELCDDRELVDMVLAWEKRLALEHFGKDATSTPDVDFDVVFLPGEHDLWSSVVSSRDVSSHLRVLNSGQTEIANLQITVLVDENITGLQISVDNTGGMYVFQTTLSMVSVRSRGSLIAGKCIPEFGRESIE